MEKLVILDYVNGDVHIYDKEEFTVVDEDLLNSLGYNAEECEWISGKLQITYHKEVV